jgi:hypothetical protein
MKTPTLIITSVGFVLVLLTLPDSSVTAQLQSESETQRPRIEFVKTADFYLRDGKFVTGKVIEDDKSKITVESRAGSAVEVLTFTKKEVDTRTLRINTMPQYRFYEELGDYFAGRTWDFRDDPDDFIQAMRAYELAKAAAVDSERRQEDIDEIQGKIEKLKSDKETWTQQTKDRAELKKLEFEATFDERTKQLENRFDATNQLLDQALKRFDAYVKQTNGNFDNLQKNLSGLNTDIARRIQSLEERIENNRQLIDDLGRYRYYGRRYYY